MSTPVLRHSRTAALALLLSGAPAILPPLLGAAGVLAPVVLMPGAAEARPGLGGSLGSRGSRTYSAPPATTTSPYGAAPMNRSMTPNSGSYGGGAYAGGGYAPARPSHPFATGLAGGLLGVGIGSLLFGHHGAYADGYGEHRSGFGNIFWTLIQLAILFFVGRWLFRRFFRRGQNVVQASPMGAPTGGFGGSSAIQITNADYQSFERALLDIQQAWSMQDLRSLSRFATPEMVSYFSEQLADLASRNLRNAVSAVRMEHGDLSEAWSENGRDFATVAMRYSMIDVTTDLTGRVVDGSPTERQTVTELWTFVRARGGSWLLSAIQQAR
ncbi:TIM44-like domain-containing protein [Acetobacteraceae bacterium KSS8]|uniref:TIM44-like domain-containing protein n=1 Tax=Endosaccharibacter trunci TaxID=2812733 RepID=A0ABT1W4K1_9PROT|nr:TIM44-like domain-containing protein [Acetobacteraceae bacterium KSS8]